MREIINLQVGRCGNQIGTQFWDQVTNEHGIESNGSFKGNVKDQIENAIVYFNESGENRYIARSVQIDLDPASNDAIMASPQAQLFNPDSFISGFGGTGNNWARGHYTDGAEIVDRAMDAVRREAEKSNLLQGFQMTHSLGGGTGSGLGTLLVSKIREEYPDNMIMTFTLFSSPKVSENILESYNATLSIHHLVEEVDNCIVLDNEALQEICQRKLGLSSPSYQDMNHVIAQAMSGVTSSFRFAGQLNSNLRNLSINLVPFPRVHFYMVSQAPIMARGQKQTKSLNMLELTQEIYSPQNMLCSADPTHGKYLTGATLFRGNIPSAEVDEQMINLQSKNQSYFVPWLPNNLKSSISDIAPKDLKNSATFIGNSSAVVEVFDKILDQYQPLYNRKAFLFKYLDEGMDGLEFEESASSIGDLKFEYLVYQNGKGDENIFSSNQNQEIENQGEELEKYGQENEIE